MRSNFRGLIFSYHQNALTVSHPAKACNPRIASVAELIFFSEKRFTNLSIILSIEIIRALFLTPAFTNILESISFENAIAIATTSVSGV